MGFGDNDQGTQHHTMGFNFGLIIWEDSSELDSFNSGLWYQEPCSKWYVTWRVSASVKCRACMDTSCVCYNIPGAQIVIICSLTLICQICWLHNSMFHVLQESGRQVHAQLMCCSIHMHESLAWVSTWWGEATTCC